MSDRGRRASVPVFVAGGLVVAGILVFVVTWATRARPITAAVPQPPPVVRQSLVPVGARQTACLSPATIPSDSQIAIMQIGTYGKPPVPLTAIASGPGGYRSVTQVPRTWTDSGPVVIPMKPPKHAVDGQFCLRNDSRRPVALYGADDRAKTVSRTTVDGTATQPNFELRFAERQPAPLVSRLGHVTEAMSVFRPIGRGLLSPLAVLVILGIPLGLVWTLRSALREDL